MNRAKGAGDVMRVLGAMSGTSLDGVDAAILKTDGERIFDFGPSDYRPYSDDERAILRAGLGKWIGPEVNRAGEVVDAAHIELLAQFEPPDLIGFHGQTLAHDPRGHGTLQVGNGVALAEALNCPVVWDFRSDDVRLGGEGAPLAPFFHFACAKWISAKEPVCFLNLGGVGNITYVNPTCDNVEDDGAVLAFDTGPANAPINDFVQARMGRTMDRDGALALEGTVETGALELFLAEPYFSRMPPKSLDRNDFPEMIGLVSELSETDAVATLTAMSAAAVAQAMDHMPSTPTRMLVTGGGRKNPVLMEMLRVSTGSDVVPVEEVGLDGDMLEAQAFAYLAARVKRGLPTSGPSTTGVRALVAGGTLSRP